MASDSSKLPAKKWLTLSQAINFLAFNDARDEEAMERDGYPSDKTYGIKIARALIRCRKEAGTNPVRSEFVKTVGKKGRLVQNYPASTRLRECEAAWPPSGQQLHDLVVQWEREREAEELKRSGAEETMKEVLASDEVKFEGCRDGRREPVNVDLIDDTSVTWTDEGFGAEPIDDGPTLIWTNVRIDRKDFDEWCHRRQQAEKGEAVVAASRAPTANQTKQQKRRGSPIKFTKDERLVQDVLAVLEDEPNRAVDPLIQELAEPLGYSIKTANDISRLVDRVRRKVNKRRNGNKRE